MPASRFLKIVQETGQIPVCSFYLPVSTSRNPTVEVKEKICKLKVNKHRLDLRKIQIASRALNIDSKIWVKASEADLMKLSSVEECMGVEAKDTKWRNPALRLSVDTPVVPSNSITVIHVCQ